MLLDIPRAKHIHWVLMDRTKGIRDRHGRIEIGNMMIYCTSWGSRLYDRLQTADPLRGKK